MADISALRRNIQIEETRFRYAVSESMAQKLGGSINFINTRQHSEKQFFINGPYNILGAQTAVDGLTFFQYDAEIIDVWMFVEYNGSSGTTELDLKRATSSGGSFSSIFSTTPKITSAAGNFAYVHAGISVSGTTAPVLSLIHVNAGDAIRCDLLQVPGGSPQGCGIIIHYRPR